LLRQTEELGQKGKLSTQEKGDITSLLLSGKRPFLLLHA
jgi:hypothetical protein